MGHLPYLDHILALRAGNTPYAAAFSRHIHWGLFANAPAGVPTLAEFQAASDRLTQCHLELARIRPGARVLDVGCGVGGTTAAILASLPEVHCVGLNIDPRQLEIARATVAAQEPRTVRFVEGDACALPFPDASFEVVLAVECIFHFGDRQRFLAEARRVLKPGGRLVFSDFMPHQPTLPLLIVWGLLRDRGQVGAYFGKTHEKPPLLTTYLEMARSVGLRLAEERDITRETLPTYVFLAHALESERDGVVPAAQRAVETMGKLSRRGWLRYRVVAFDA
jgi:ubiquinone/menaquinone biosynthesis C-methylase UbiE